MSYFDDEDDLVAVNLEAEDENDDQFEFGQSNINNIDNGNNQQLDNNENQEPINENDDSIEEYDLGEERLDFDEADQAYNKFKLDENGRIKPINELLSDGTEIEQYCEVYGINETALKTIIENRLDMSKLSRMQLDNLNQHIDFDYKVKLDGRGQVLETNDDLGEFDKYKNVSIDNFKTGDFYKGTNITSNDHFVTKEISPDDFAKGVYNVFDVEAKKYNMLSRQELIARNMAAGTTEDEYLDGHERPILNSNEVEPLDTSKLSYEDIQRINNSKNSIIDLDNAVDTYRLNQDRAMALLLGEGNPINANVAVLDKEALKQGKYKYDLQAIKKFENAINISDEQIKDRAASNATFDSLKMAIDSSHDKLMVRNHIETGKSVNRNDMQIDYMISFAENLRRAESIYNKTSFFKKLFSPFSAYRARKAIDEKKALLREYVGEHAANEYLNSTPDNREKATEYLRRATISSLFPDRIKSNLKDTISNKATKNLNDINTRIEEIKEVINTNNKLIEAEDKELKPETIPSFLKNKNAQYNVINDIQKTFDKIIEKNKNNNLDEVDLKKYVGAVTLVSSLEKLGIQCSKEVADGKEFAGVFINTKFGKENIEKEMLNSANAKYAPLEGVGNDFNCYQMLQGACKKEIIGNINLFEQSKIDALNYKKGLCEQKKNNVSAEVDDYFKDKDIKQALQNDYNNILEANYLNGKNYFSKGKDLSEFSKFDTFTNEEMKQFNDISKGYKQKIFNKDLKDVFEKKDPSKVGQVKVKAQVLDMNKDFKK